MAAKAPKDLVAEYVHIVSQAAKVRIETARDDFASWPKKEREETLARTARLTTWEVGRSFDLFADSIWETICTACTSKAFLAGVKFDEEISEEVDEEYLRRRNSRRLLHGGRISMPRLRFIFYSRDKIEAAQSKWVIQRPKIGSANMSRIMVMISPSGNSEINLTSFCSGS